jgi:hypothetical protein
MTNSEMLSPKHNGIEHKKKKKKKSGGVNVGVTGTTDSLLDCWASIVNAG